MALKDAGVEYCCPGKEKLVRKTLESLERKKFLKRLWAKDPELWVGKKNKDFPSHAANINNSLGWLPVVKEMSGKAGELTSFADGVRKDGFTHAVLLGMGGSSLAPLVYKEIFGTRKGFLKLVVLDTTDPDAILKAENSVDIVNTIFILASKSGSTIEPNCLFEYFYSKVKALKGERAGENFIAITDPNTSLSELASKLSFRRTFLNPSDIGGRYSSLSYFGLVPAALIGVDLNRLLSSALTMSESCSASYENESSPGVRFGAFLGAFAKEGRNKVTFFISKELSSFSLWIEQLIAESTGKEGVGIVPVSGEERGKNKYYSKDRVFVCITLKGGKLPGKPKALIKAGHPVVAMVLSDKYSLGAEMLRWEVATAVAGAVLGINPFDQPDVESAKIKAREFLKGFEGGGGRDYGSKPYYDGVALNIHLSTSAQKIARGAITPQGALQKILSMSKNGGGYTAILPFMDYFDKKICKPLAMIRSGLLASTRGATLFGYGPRYLHSTGQLHKGGPREGAFFFFIKDRGCDGDLQVPGKPYSFGILELAQLLGDMEALNKAGKPCVLFVVKGSEVKALGEVSRLFRLKDGK